MRLALLAAVALLALPAVAHAAPPNDDFADAVDLSAIDPDESSVSGTNVGATKETGDGEPDHAGNAGGRSVWYAWTAPGDGSVPHVAFVTFGFDTLLGVYTGTDVGALVEVASNDDERPFGGGGSAVSFATTPSTTYYVALDGFGGKSGRFVLEWFPSPENDGFAEATVLTGAAGARSGDTIAGATAEPGEDDFVGGGTVWYAWTPPADGTYKLSTVGSGFDTVVVAYTGTELADLELVAFNDDDPDRGCCSSWIPLVDAEATATYYFQVMSIGGASPSIKLSWGPLILGRNRADTITGTAGAEEIRGRNGNDVINGGGGNDLIFGGRGNDVLRGGGGADLLFDHFGTDSLAGGSGADVLDARDRRGGDVLGGGGGNDRCRADAGDRRRSC